MSLEELTVLKRAMQEQICLLLEEGFGMSVELLAIYQRKYAEKKLSLRDYDQQSGELNRLQKEAENLQLKIDDYAFIREGHAAELVQILERDRSYQLRNRTLAAMSKLLLEFYSGNLYAFGVSSRRLNEQLKKQPVEVSVIAEKGACENELYHICKEAEGKYEKFSDLTRKITEALAKGEVRPSWNLLSVLFDGIYVGEPEDLRNYRNGETASIIYPTKGLGEKIARIKFLPRD